MSSPSLSGYLACAVLWGSASVVAAQDAQAPIEQSAAVASTGAQLAPVKRRAEIGAATLTLLQMQREGQAVRARPIDGHQAERIYTRYLKSFEQPIPASYDTGLDAKQ